MRQNAASTTIKETRSAGRAVAPSRAVALLAPLLLVALGAIPMPGDAAHGEHPPACNDEVFFHLCLDIYELEPGETKIRHLSSPEGDLRAGWVYIIYGGVDGQGTVTATLEANGEPVDQFVWTPGFHKNSTKIQQTGPHDLVLHNPSNDTAARYAFYYDQSCNCAGKLIPLPGGFVLFNYELPADTDVTIRFPLIDGWGLEGAVARLDPDAQFARWPADYTLLMQSKAEDKGWLTFDFHTQERGTYYLFLQETKGASPSEPITLTPEITVHEDVEDAPGAASGILLAALVAVIGLATSGGRRKAS